MDLTAQINKTSQKAQQQKPAGDPLEILNNVRDQVFGPENSQQTNQENNVSLNNSPTDEEIEYKKQSAEQDGRHLEALEKELRDIRLQNTYNELNQKIQSGEDIPIEAFSELSYEQRDVLKAQLEAYKAKKISSMNQGTGLVEPASKKGRNFFGGMKRKQAAEKQQTRVEIPLSPSG